MSTALSRRIHRLHRPFPDCEVLREHIPQARHCAAAEASDLYRLKAMMTIELVIPMVFEHRGSLQQGPATEIVLKICSMRTSNEPIIDVFGSMMRSRV